MERNIYKQIGEIYPQSDDRGFLRRWWRLQGIHIIAVQSLISHDHRASAASSRLFARVFIGLGFLLCWASASAATLVKVYADKPLVIVKLSPEEQLQIETADILGIRFRDHDGLHWVKVGKFSKKHDRVILRFKERPIFLIEGLEFDFATETKGMASPPISDATSEPTAETSAAPVAEAVPKHKSWPLISGIPSLIDSENDEIIANTASLSRKINDADGEQITAGYNFGVKPSFDFGPWQGSGSLELNKASLKTQFNGGSRATDALQAALSLAKSWRERLVVGAAYSYVTVNQQNADLKYVYSGGTPTFAIGFLQLQSTYYLFFTPLAKFKGKYSGPSEEDQPPSEDLQLSSQVGVVLQKVTTANSAIEAELAYDLDNAPHPKRDALKLNEKIRFMLGQRFDLSENYAFLGGIIRNQSSLPGQILTLEASAGVPTLGLFVGACGFWGRFSLQARFEMATGAVKRDVRSSDGSELISASTTTQKARMANMLLNARYQF